MTSRGELAARDQADPLAELRQGFDLPAGLVYLNGNSLGPLTHAARQRLRALVDEEWGQGLVGSWNTADWVGLPERVGARIAPLIGAAPDEVIATDSISINLYKLLTAACRLRPGRAVILSEAGDFPTDSYIAASVAEASGLTFRRVPREQLPDAINEDVAALLLGHVSYRDGYRQPLPALCAAARQKGALTLWDLAHSAGAVPLDLDGTGADFAVGCGYKFLNGGPGAPAFAYAARRWHDALSQPLTGWFGHARPFDFVADFEAALDLRSLQSGTPGILGLSALDAALTVFEGIDMDALHRRSIELFDLFLALGDPWLADAGFSLLTPRDPAQRGSQISLRHPQAQWITNALAAQGVIGDFRPPDILRLALTPLYTRRVDIWEAATRLQTIMREAQWQRAEHQISRTVT